MKVDIKRNDTVSTQIEYEVYNPNNLEKLNLSICEDKNAKINLYPPINLDPNIVKLAKQLKEQGYDLFDSSDNFYNDICSPYNSFNKTDVILKDRKNDFYLPNISLCEETCEYEDLDLELLKAKCTCNVKTEIKYEKQVKFKPNKIIENFYKIEKYANVRIIKCYKAVFDLNIFKKNYGNYIILIIGSIYIFLMITIFFKLKQKVLNRIQKLIKENNSLKSKLKKLQEKNNNKISQDIKIKNTNNKINEKMNSNSSLISSQKIKFKMRKHNNTEGNNKAIKIKNKKNKNKINIIKKKLKNPIKKKNNLSIKINNNKEKGSQSCKELFIQKKFLNKNMKSINIINVKGIFVNQNQLNSLKVETKEMLKKKEGQNKDINIIDKIIKYFPKEERSQFFTEDELNGFEYNYALKIDFRNYFQFYFSLLKQTHLIIFTFFVINDYNIFLLKLSLFLISFSLFFFMNALFFNDDSMHKIYEDEGKYDLFYQIPQTLYSTIISQVISSLLELLSLSQDDILDIKNEGMKKINVKIIKLDKCIKIKCSIFFAIGIILLFCFWYYLSAFCAIYYNTQMPLIKDTFVSFFMSMIYPFILDLIPGVFRIISLRYKIKFLYIISNITIKLIGIL